MDELLSIGRFARLCGLSGGALRHYGELGLLRPTAVDDATGYRRYRREQVPQARAIARLRELDLSLDEIREVLATGDLELLRRHRARVEARVWRGQRALHMLQRLIDGKDDLMGEPVTTEVNHRQLGVDLFNATWTLLEKSERTREEDDELLHRAHASAYHWLQAPECSPENRARSEWLCSRVYAVLLRPEPALHHARRCLELCEEHGIGDFDIAYAYEALTRASRLAGDAEAAGRYAELARAAAEAIADPDDREHFEEDLAAVAG